MGFLTRFTNGYQVAVASLKVLNEHKKLIVFPLLSGLSQILILGSFFSFIFSSSNSLSADSEVGSVAVLGVIFLFYLIGYFITVYFNMALMYCANQYFEGNDVSVATGLSFSLSRIGVILSWAVFAATVGTILKALQDNLGYFGKIFVGLIGITWSIATFFVIPVLAFEKLGPIDAIKRSTSIMQKKWGEGIGANFSIMLVCMIAFLPLAVVGMGVSSLVNEGAGIAVLVTGMVLFVAVGSALHSIFISAIYSSLQGNTTSTFDEKIVDKLFR